MRKIIGVFGISGVGKSHLSNKVSLIRGEFISVKASEVIKNSGGKIGHNDISENDLKNNQNLLVNNFHRAVGIEKNIMFELHNVVELRDGLRNIEAGVFEKIPLDCACFIYENPSVIINNRLNDKSRFRSNHKIDVINRFQMESLCVFNEFYRNKKIPSTVICSDHLAGFFDFFENVVNLSSEN